jgi:hypothetical protein
LIFRLGELIEEPFVGILPGRTFPIENFAQCPASWRVISVCKKRLAPHQMLTIKASSIVVANIHGSSLKLADPLGNLTLPKTHLFQHLTHENHPPQGVISFSV